MPTGAAGDRGVPKEWRSMTTASRRVSFFTGCLLLLLFNASTASGGTTYNFESCNLGPIGGLE